MNRMRYVLLMLPQIAMPTPQVYRTFDEMKLGREDALSNEPDWSAWTKLPSQDLLPLLMNDLEPPAFAIAPQLNELREQAQRLLTRIVRMSGSGSSLFTLYDEQHEAEHAAAALRSQLHIDARALELAPKLSDDLSV